MKTAEEIKNDLHNFYGTQAYYRYRQLGIELLLTDGVKFLAEAAECFWLVDVILSHQPRCREDRMCRDMQFWTIRKQADGTFLVTCDRDSGNELLRQEIPFSDFPLDEQRIWVQRGGIGYVAMLPSEY